MRRLHLTILSHVVASYASLAVMLWPMGVRDFWVDFGHSPGFTAQVVLAPATQLIHLPLYAAELFVRPRLMLLYPLAAHATVFGLVWLGVRLLGRWRAPGALGTAPPTP